MRRLAAGDEGGMLGLADSRGGGRANSHWWAGRTVMEASERTVIGEMLAGGRGGHADWRDQTEGGRGARRG